MTRRGLELQEPGLLKDLRRLLERRDKSRPHRPLPVDHHLLVFVSRCGFCFSLHNHRQSPPRQGVTAQGFLSFAQPTIPPRTISWGTRAPGKGPPNPSLAQALLEFLHAAKHGRCCQLSGEPSERTAAFT